MTARQLPRSEYNGLKTVFRELVRRLGGTTHAASLTRVRQQEVSNYGSLEAEYAERFAPIDIIADLESEVGPVVTRELARLSNHILVPMPAVVRSNSPLGRITGKAMKETAEVFVRIGAVLDDEKITQAERVAFRREIQEAMTALAALDLQVEAESRGGE
ncbi:MAG TPA: phage regulatory CII family protein [Devosiaceae bacterium]|jgi:hypothetical protein|nr:phage regulatory CII family protein [Devosiaceae bacterium]